MTLDHTTDTRRRSMSGLFGRLLRRRDGATVIEFALLSMPFFLIVFASLETFVAFSAEQSGNLIARISRNAVGNAMRGGAIGATKTSNVFAETADLIGSATTQAGIFAATRNVG